ncbi:HAMP domain-containing protein, partial [candidate division KSB1 bacterium]
MKWTKFRDFSLFRGLGRKILLSFLFLSLVPLFISTFVGYRSSREELSLAVLARLDAQADFKTYRLEQFLNPLNRTLLSLLKEKREVFLGALPGLAESSESSLDWINLNVNSLFDGVVAAQPHIRAVALTDMDGRLLGVRPESYDGLDPSRIATPNVIGRRARSPGLALQSFDPNGESSLVISYRISDNNGRSRGFLIALVDCHTLTEAIGTGSELGRTGSVCLTNQDGYLVFASHLEACTNPSPVRLQSDGLAQCLQGIDGAGVYLNHEDRWVQGVYRWLPDVKACLLVEIDTREAFATLNLLRNQAVTVGLLLFVLLFLTSIFLTRGITRPIHRLVAAVQETASGDLGKEVDVHSRDEMGMLAREFNVMAEKLRRSYAGLEEEVEQRTRELKSAQDQLIQIGKLAAVGELAGGMAHEINNPTGIILTRVGYLLSEIRDGRLALEFEEDLKTLEIHAKRIARITNGLLTFSRHS